MTPRSGRIPMQYRRKIPLFALNASNLASSPTTASGSASSDDTGLEEETLPSAEASTVEEDDAEEQRQLIKSQGKRIEELTLQIQVRKGAVFIKAMFSKGIAMKWNMNRNGIEMG